MHPNRTITIQAVINAPVEKVWEIYTTPEHITQWNFATNDWHSPRAESDLRTGGKFKYRMEAKDKSAGFDFTGTFDEVKPNESIVYTIADGRKVRITFSEINLKTDVTVKFEAENTNSMELQRSGWQSILDNFKKYTEEK